MILATDSFEKSSAFSPQAASDLPTPKNAAYSICSAEKITLRFEKPEVHWVISKPRAPVVVEEKNFGDFQQDPIFVDDTDHL